MKSTITQSHIDGFDIATGERPAPRPDAPTFAQAFAARLFGVVLLALLATALIKCTA